MIKEILDEYYRHYLFCPSKIIPTLALQREQTQVCGAGCTTICQQPNTSIHFNLGYFSATNCHGSQLRGEPRSPSMLDLNKMLIFGSFIGELDDETSKMMELPRCGVRDKVGFGESRAKRYALQGKILKHCQKLNEFEAYVLECVEVNIIYPLPVHSHVGKTH